MTVTPRSWSPQASLVGFGWLLTAAAAAWTALTNDNVARLMTGVSAVLLLLISLHGTVARPRLRADEQGLTVRGLFRRRSWQWAQIRYRIDHTRRLGRVSTSLELTVLPDDELVILSRIDLGADPEDVIDALRSLRPDLD